MRIALAQIDVRLGDLDEIAERLERQASLAAEQGAGLVCAPASLLAGAVPGALVENADFEHDVLTMLHRLAARLEPMGIACLVPAVVAYDETPLFEVFLLREGEVAPLRLMTLRHHGDAGVPPWTPPVFEHAGMRIGVSADALRDLSLLPAGCDLLVHFQIEGFVAADAATAGVVGLAESGLDVEVAKAGVWLAHMAPIGAFDETVYTGGSFVLDESGRVVAAAPSFEEALLVQEVERGGMVAPVPEHELARFERPVWLWEALRLAVRDALPAFGADRVAVPLTGDLPSSLLAALAVDALGPRKVLGIVCGARRACTPQAEARACERVACAREVAAALRLRTLEVDPADGARVFEGAGSEYADVRDAELMALQCADIAREQRAVLLSPLTKTGNALAARSDAMGWRAGAFAPFGDVYLSALEFIARARSHVSAVLPERLMGLASVRDAMDEVIGAAIGARGMDAAYAEPVRALLRALEPQQVDAVLAAHIDRGLALEEIDVPGVSAEARAVLLLLVRQGESGRRVAPPCPWCSPRPFANRTWPRALAWSDTGLQGAERLRAVDDADAAYRRLSERGRSRNEQARGEVVGLIAEALGLTDEQRTELESAEGRQHIKAELQDADGQLRALLSRMVQAGAQGTVGFSGPFFSLN